MELALLFLATLPVIILLSIVYNLDKNKEPLKLCFKLFIFGIISCFIIGEINLYFDPVSYIDKNLLFIILYNFLYVGFLEEGIKWICTYFIGYKNSEFNEDYDIILYAIIVALGFAFFENVFYVLEGGYIVAILRAFFAIPAHLCYGTFMGYYLLLFNKTNKRKYYILSIIYPVILHGFYDICLFLSSWILTLIFICYIFVLFIRTIFILKKILKNS